MRNWLRNKFYTYMEKNFGKGQLYKYRHLPIYRGSKFSNERQPAPYAIYGDDLINQTSGLLEACYSLNDALEIFELMKSFKYQFKNLSYNQIHK